MLAVPSRRALTTLAIAASLALAAGCGSDDDGGGGEPRTVAIKLSGSGRDPRYTVPKSVPGGVVRLEFTNDATGEHGAQLVRVDAGHSARDGLQAAGEWAEGGKSLPSWVHTAGGVGTTPSGTTHSATQELPPGQYAVVDIDTNARAFFEVTAAEGEAELPGTDARIDELEYRFSATGLEAGRNPVLIENKGDEPHFTEALRIKEGKTIADVRRFVREDKGDPPVEGGPNSTAVADGGFRQVVELNLKKGDYALLCFVPDRKGGPPHAVKGMVSQATVE